MIGLIQNELIKIFRQISWKIMIALLLIAAVGAPVFFRLNMSPIEYGISAEKHYKNAADFLEITDPMTMEGQHRKAVYEVAKYIYENNIDISGWRYELYLNLEKSYMTEKALELIDQGKSSEETMRNFHNSFLHYDNRENTVYYLNETDSDKGSNLLHFFDTFGNLIIYQMIPINSNNMSSFRDMARESTERYREFISVDRKDYADLRLKELNKSILQLKTDLADLEKEYKKDSSKMNQYYIAQNRLFAMNAAINCWEKFKTCSEENENWIHAAAMKLHGGIFGQESGEATLYAPNDKEYFKNELGEYDFSLNFGGSKLNSFKSYEDYLAFAQNKRNDFTASVRTLLYSVENEIPNSHSDTERIALREVFERCITIDLYLAMFLCVFLASVIMSSEYSSGSIRLLMIRPYARWKILLAKLAAVIIFCAVTMIGSFALTSLTSLAALGDGVLIPFISANAVQAWQTPSLLYIFKNALIDGSSMFLAAMLAFTLSLFVKRGVLSIALGIGIFAAGQLLAIVSQFVVAYVEVIRYTIFPYLINMQNIRYEPLDHIMEYNFYFSDSGFTLSLGLTVIGIHTAVLTALAFAAFIKQQVKS